MGLVLAIVGGALLFFAYSRRRSLERRGRSRVSRGAGLTEALGVMLAAIGTAFLIIEIAI